jgi:hypothetical protein
MSKQGMLGELALGAMPAFAAVAQLYHLRYEVITTPPDCCAPLDCIGGPWVSFGSNVSGPDKQRKQGRY